MGEILDRHKQDFNEIRRLCLICHGLDLSSSWIFTDSIYEIPSDNTISVLHSLLSSSLLKLAISIRINLYQGEIENREIPLETLAADYYEDDALVISSVSIKDVCDKIIHADTVNKAVFPKGLIPKDVKNTIQLKGINRNRAWTLNLCLERFAETVLVLLDEIEENT